jgi:hypothetical protein
MLVLVEGSSHSPLVLKLVYITLLGSAQTEQPAEGACCNMKPDYTS